MKKIAGLAHFKKNIPPDADDKTKNNTNCLFPDIGGSNLKKSLIRLKRIKV